MSFPTRFGSMGVGDLGALADAAHAGATGLAVGSTMKNEKDLQQYQQTRPADV
jgi:hypothetical protein